MKSSYICSHCDGIVKVFLMPDPFGGLRLGIPRSVAEGTIGKRNQRGMRYIRRNWGALSISILSLCTVRSRMTEVEWR